MGFGHHRCPDNTGSSLVCAPSPAPASGAASPRRAGSATMAMESQWNLLLSVGIRSTDVRAISDPRGQGIMEDSRTK
jgi:hypothetical protein